MHDVTVVLAVARGSYAWGGASPASDYDVGFVFVPTDFRRYAHLQRPDETIVIQREERGDSGDQDVGAHGDCGDDSDRGNDSGDGRDSTTGDENRAEFDYQGWDIRQFMRLLANSNDGAIDLLRSPIRYRLACDPSVLDELRVYVERTYNPMDLYHAYRGIATSNYRKYISHHLVRSDDELFPIVETRADEYVVETAEPADTLATDGDDVPTTTIAADDERFTETQTKPTVKRNLTIYRAAMAARYLKATGECGETGGNTVATGDAGTDTNTSHDLPALEFEQFLTEQAPAVFDTERIQRARDLLERKRRGEGDEEVGDVVGREFAQPSVEIEPSIHVRSGPEPARLDEFTDELLAAVL
ncbi:nucleotidyltransferase, predicted [Natrialba magadii ATCC 43099]|uniref:Nucleotidyltransferase, predicted n=1 Tax=Natrialba magadii (strain ATCC 43099 / DSM 3394 / CCM 3739 / CIP 104546 / IAM 13178 / JCM 8861 / NBRC 102185 / NCIMB 2190 / MS3) TaxID=547559 RepID=D3T0C5_NATMM|nr:nucleotidyltransferase, predicted [Natrialba magadii ATCC 43099]